jgi:transposase
MNLPRPGTSRDFGNYPLDTCTCLCYLGGMSKSNRNAPRRSSASESRYTFYEFDREFPDDTACLDWLVGHLYPDGIFCPKCQKVTKHHRLKARPAYVCQFCGHQEYPMKGTIFEDSATSLKLWFHAFYLMAQTRCGISAKQIEREIGVTYKTAWRMANKIRSLLMDDEDEEYPLAGTIEIDEAYWGGKDKWRHKNKKQHHHGRKTPILGMAQRKGAGEPGRIVARVLPDVTESTILPYVSKKVLPRSTVYTDEGRNLQNIGAIGYRQSRVNHAQGVYVTGDAHANSVEGFWSLIRRGIGGVYHSVSTKHLQSYLDEYTFRYNNRDANGRGMFEAFLSRIGKVREASS